MKKILILMVIAMPASAWAQAKPQKGMVRDTCAPIGKTADGQLVYGMACNAMPVPMAPPRAQTTAAPPVEPEPEIERSGIFGMSYTRKPPSQ